MGARVKKRQTILVFPGPASVCCGRPRAISSRRRPDGGDSHPPARTGRPGRAPKPAGRAARSGSVRGALQSLRQTRREGQSSTRHKKAGRGRTPESWRNIAAGGSCGACLHAPAAARACRRNPREERAPGRRTRAPARRIPPGAALCRKDSGANGPATPRGRGGARPRIWITAGARGARPDPCSMGRSRPPRPPAARFWISLPCVFCTLRPVGSPPVAGIPGLTEARRGLAGWRTCCQGCPAHERPARSQRGFRALARPVPTAALSTSRLSLSAASYKDLALPACATVPSVRLRAPCWASPNRHCLGGKSPACPPERQ